MHFAVGQFTWGFFLLLPLGAQRGTQMHPPSAACLTLSPRCRRWSSSSCTYQCFLNPAVRPYITPLLKCRCEHSHASCKKHNTQVTINFKAQKLSSLANSLLVQGEVGLGPAGKLCWMIPGRDSGRIKSPNLPQMLGFSGAPVDFPPFFLLWTFGSQKISSMSLRTLPLRAKMIGPNAYITRNVYHRFFFQPLPVSL